MNETQTTGNEAPVQDTANTQNSEADVVDTNAPEATQEQAPAQETAAPDTTAEDTAEEKLLAGKYKSVEDLEKSYQELQSKYGKEASERAELTRILNDAFSSPEPAQTAQDTNEDVFQDNSQESPEIEQLRRDNAVTRFILTHDDAEASKMQEILSSDPLVQQISGHEARLEYAYQKSQNMSHSQALAEAKKTGAQQAQAKAAEKQVAQVETAKKSAPVNDRAEKLARARYGDKQARADLISEIPAVQAMKRMAGLE